MYKKIGGCCEGWLNSWTIFIYFIYKSHQIALINTMNGRFECFWIKFNFMRIWNSILTACIVCIVVVIFFGNNLLDCSWHICYLRMLLVKTILICHRLYKIQQSNQFNKRMVLIKSFTKWEIVYALMISCIFHAFSVYCILH